jgi:uncharacterized protein (DUF2164 family)
MTPGPDDSPLRIKLADERRGRLLYTVKEYFAENFDEDLSEFRAEALIDFFIEQLGPAVYNQGVRDACSQIQEKLLDIEGEVFEPERQ